MIIGSSIQEAIDWTQDYLGTTRPLAEQTLFSLLASKIIEETNGGFIFDEIDKDEVNKRHDTVKHQFTKNWRRYRFHAKRKDIKLNKHKQMSKQKPLDNSDAANDMWNADDQTNDQENLKG